MTSNDTLNVDGTDTLPITVRVALILATLGQHVQYGNVATGYTVNYDAKRGAATVACWRRSRLERAQIADNAERLLSGIGYNVIVLADEQYANYSLIVREA